MAVLNIRNLLNAVHAGLRIRTVVIEPQEALFAANLKIKELTARLNQNSRNSN